MHVYFVSKDSIDSVYNFCRGGSEPSAFRKREDANKLDVEVSI